MQLRTRLQFISSFAAILLCFGIEATAGRAVAAEDAAQSPHDYTIRVRGEVWFSQLTGDVSDRGSAPGVGSVKVDVDLDDDLGLGDYEATPSGSANLRIGGHDIWLAGFDYSNSVTETVDETFSFGGTTFTANTQVSSDVDLSRIDLVYGYSFFDFEEDGFRLGPTVTISYVDIDAEFVDLTTGTSEGFDAAIPVPLLGVHSEVPFYDFVGELDVSGIYANVGDVEGTGVRGSFNVAWRPLDYLGLVAGYRFIYFDGDIEDVDVDLFIHGPSVGLELRY